MDDGVVRGVKAVIPEAVQRSIQTKDQDLPILARYGTKIPSRALGQTLIDMWFRETKGIYQAEGAERGKNRHLALVLGVGETALAAWMQPATKSSKAGNRQPAFYTLMRLCHELKKAIYLSPDGDLRIVDQLPADRPGTSSIVSLLERLAKASRENAVTADLLAEVDEVVGCFQ